VGDTLRCRLTRLLKNDEGTARVLDEDLLCEIRGYWHELHLPTEVVEKYSITEGDVVEILVEQ
jgi:hypothetical protein